MTYKVTALKDVRFLTHLRRKKAVEIGGVIGMRPYETREWISLRRGESRDGLGLLMGIDPHFLPQEQGLTVEGESFVPLSGSLDILPKDFFGLLRIEAGTDGLRR